MPYPEDNWLSEVRKSDAAFLKAMGIEDCVVDDPFAVPLPLPYPPEPFVDLTEYDQVLLQALAVVWVHGSIKEAR
jgi:hypothetical protein